MATMTKNHADEDHEDAVVDDDDDDDDEEEEEEEAGDDDTPQELKSAYQVAREANIRRNLAELEALGLDLSAGDDEGAPAKKEEKKPKSERQKRTRAAAPREPQRKSRRIANMPALAAAAAAEAEKGKPARWRVHTLEGDETGSASERARLATMERKLERLKELHLKEGSSYKNPTATYEHTWMRVRTMSDKALARRISVIEKQCGEHCIVKMRMFAEVLILADKAKLAKDAEAALKRLTSLVTRA